MNRSAAWPALVLAAGLGTRLRPLSGVRAKAALPVAGRPIIIRILEQLRSAGVERVVVNLHHRPETIAAVVGDGQHLGLEVRYSWEPVVLGSGGGPARALPLLAADRFFIVNGDTLAPVDLVALAAEHRASGAMATLAVVPAALAAYNAILADAGGRWTGVASRGTSVTGLPGTPWHFVGVQAVNASAFASVDASCPSETVREIYPRLAAQRPGAVRVTHYRRVLRRRHVSRLLRDGPPRRGGRAPAARSWKGCRHPSHGTGMDCILWDRITVGAGPASPAASSLTT
jgi:mannose-1-phosphate guanylyltransferase